MYDFTDWEHEPRKGWGVTFAFYAGMAVVIVAVEIVVIAIAAGLFFLALSLTEAKAHDALPTAAKPQGWTFDYRCCGSFDCYPVQTDAIRETPNGYQIGATGEVIPYQSKKVLPSPDGLPYRCSTGGKTEAPTICIYVPKGGV